MEEIKEEDRKRLLSDVNSENYFRVANGTIVKGLMGLDSSLEGMGEETFRYHVNDYRNDFSTWIRGTINDEKLANDLLLSKDKCKTQIIILRRIVEILSS
ncbi:hypothetical protein HYY70_04060 [Candidatus Woesearchaeota archaeon]|nr:hypothetical protein [Candidatus Woesearchaeota archaeon]